MKNILIHCAMQKEGMQIAKALNLTKKENKYVDVAKLNEKINCTRSKDNELIQDFITIYSNCVEGINKSENIDNEVLKNNNINLIITGIGKQKTAIGLTKYLCENDKPDLIINLGYAGSVNCKIGNWISINKSYNLEWDIPGEQKYSMDDLGGQDLVTIDELEKLPCYSSECFVNSTDIKENVIFDMELHSISLIADLYNIPLASLKKVSDNLSMDDYYKTIDNNELFELESSIKYIKKLINERQNICS